MSEQPSDSVQGHTSNLEKEISSDTSVPVVVSTSSVETYHECAIDFSTSSRKPLSSVKTDLEYSSDFSTSMQKPLSAVGTDVEYSSDYSSSIQNPLSNVKTDLEYSSDCSTSVNEPFSSLKGQSECSSYENKSDRCSSSDQLILSGSDRESSIIWCDVCKDKKLVKAYKLCVDCKEYLCRECCDFHMKLRVLQDHVLQDKNDILKAKDQTDGTDVCKEKCSNHAEKVIEFFCKSCDQIGCTICVTTQHNKCSSLHHIPSIVKGFKDTEEYEEVNGILKSVARQLEQNKARYETNIQKKGYYSKIARSEMKKHRNEINAMLDAFENQIISEIDSVEIYNSELLKTIHHRQESLAIDLQSIISDFEFKENNEQMCELFIAMKMAKIKLEHLQDRLMKLDINNHVVSYKFKASEDIDELKERIKHSGKLQLIHSSQEKDEVLREELEIKADSDKVAGTISGLCFLNKDKLVLTDLRNEVVKVIETNEGSILTTFAMPSKPWDVAKTELDEVAVTLPNDRKIILLSINQAGSTEKKEEISVNGSCRGIAYKSGQIFVSIDKPECMIQILDKTGQVMKCLKEDQFGNKLFQKPWYLTLSPDGFTIFASDNAGNQITSLTLEGKVKAIYKNKDLRKPVGVTVDGDGSVYVLGSSIYSSNIYQLSENLSQIHVHTSIGEGITNPRSAVFDNRTQKLYVGMEFSDKMQVISMSTIQS